MILVKEKNWRELCCISWFEDAQFNISEMGMTVFFLVARDIMVNFTNSVILNFMRFPIYKCSWFNLHTICYEEKLEYLWNLLFLKTLNDCKDGINDNART